MSTYQKSTKQVSLQPSMFNAQADGFHDIVVKDADFIEKAKGNILMSLVYEDQDGNEYTNIVFVDPNPNSVFAKIVRMCKEDGAETLHVDDLIDQEFTIKLETKGEWQNIVSVMPIEEQPKKKTKKKKKKQHFEYDEEEYDEEDDY